MVTAILIWLNDWMWDVKEVSVWATVTDESISPSAPLQHHSVLNCPCDHILVTWFYKSLYLLVWEKPSLCASCLWALLSRRSGLGKRSAGWSRRPCFWFEDEWSSTARWGETLSRQKTSGGLCPSGSKSWWEKWKRKRLEGLSTSQKLITLLCIYLHYSYNMDNKSRGKRPSQPRLIILFLKVWQSSLDIFLLKISTLWITGLWSEMNGTKSRQKFTQNSSQTTMSFSSIKYPVKCQWSVELLRML